MVRGSIIIGLYIELSCHRTLRFNFSSERSRTQRECVVTIRTDDGHRLLAQPAHRF